MAADNLRQTSGAGPAMIVMVGAPGSGKSYLAAALRAAIGADLIQTDAVRKELFERPRYTGSEAATVYAVCHDRIRASLRRPAHVIFDGTNLREHWRRGLYRLAHEERANLIVISAYASEPVIRSRLAGRMTHRTEGDLSDADWSIYRRLRHDAEPIGQPHIVVNTQTGFGPVIRLLKERLAGASGPVAARLS